MAVASFPMQRVGLAARRVLLGAVGGAAAMIVVHLALAGTFWNSEEGVYALTARLFLHGHALYDQTAAAQPPGVYVLGAGLLAIHDGLEWLRFAVGLLQVGAGLLAAQIVWRTTGSVLASVVTPAAIILTPWAVHEHGSLTPELVSLPVLLGAIVASQRPRTLVLGGVLCGLLPLIKLPDAVPALVIILLSAGVRRTLISAAIVFALGVLVTYGLAGHAVVTDILVAQGQSGTRSLGAIKGWFLQAGWNLVALVFAATLALILRRRADDSRQLRVVLATSVAMLLTLLTDFKNGTGLNVTVPVEAVLVPCAVTGLVLAARWARDADARSRARWVATVLAACGLLFMLAQSASLMLSPRDPEPFLRAGSSKIGWAVGLDRPEMRRAVRDARACPPSSFYAGTPLVAFAAGRRVRGDQPDGFITALPALNHVRAEISAAQPICSARAS
jgi:hypothetical protein